MITFRWTGAGGGPCTVAADRVTFEAQHVAFWARDGMGGFTLLLAVRAEAVHDLYPAAPEETP